MKYIYQNLNNSRLYTWQGQVLKVENFQSCCSFIALSGIKLKLATSQWPGGGRINHTFILLHTSMLSTDTLFLPREILN